MANQKQERAKVYASIPATTIIHIGHWYYLLCEGVMRFVPVRKQPTPRIGYEDGSNCG